MSPTSPTSPTRTAPTSKGHLTPGTAGTSVQRFEVAVELRDLVRFVWLARWDLSPGEVSCQRMLMYPTFNVVVEAGRAIIFGPDARVATRELAGTSWALGILMRPAAGGVLSPVPPAELLGGRAQVLADAPIADVERAVQARHVEADVVASVTTLLSRWLGPAAARVDERGRLLNEACRLAEEDATLVRVEELARRVGVSRRTLERLVASGIGVTPKWLMECRRLQEAATALRRNPATELTRLALDLGYVDYAHFSKRYKDVLGETPDETRKRR